MPRGPWRLPPRDLPRIGAYELRAEIGSGGMGTVYLAAAAWPGGTAKLVAIKTLKASSSAQLLDEARVIAVLHHPHIVQIHDVVADDAGCSLVMEYVHGEALSELVRELGRVPDRIAIRLCEHICDALVAVHEQRDREGQPLRIVHRDVSPQNILVGYDGVPKLVDFGIARAALPRAITDDGVVKGRSAYMPPEQRQGGVLDGRADLYALGIVLYELTTGKHPWDVDATATEPPSPRTIRADYPEGLARVVAQATRADAAERFADARAMLQALRAAGAELGGEVSRFDIAELVQGKFAERRAGKERVIATAASPSSETETLGTPNTPSPPSAPVAAAPVATASITATAHARSRLPIIVAAGTVAVAVLGVSAWAILRREPAPAAAADAGVCLLATASDSVEDREATWLGVRLVGAALEDGLAPFHAYRMPDRDAEAACGARRRLRVAATRAGRLRLELDRRAVTHTDPDPRTATTRAVTELLGARAGERLAGLPADPQVLASLVRVREHLVLEQFDAPARNALDALVREAPSLAEAQMYDVIVRWLAGEALTGVRGAHPIVDALVALADGDEATAIARAAMVAEDRRTASDPLALYLVGEVYLHGGRATDGARYLEQAMVLEPQLVPAIHHVYERRLAEGDWAAVERLAVLRERLDPAGPHALELRAHAALGAGRYGDATRLLGQLLDRTEGDTAASIRPNVALVHALILQGEEARALERAREVSASHSGRGVAASMVEPIAYALVAARKDEPARADWEARMRKKLGDEYTSPNQWQLAYTMAITDVLVGVPGARARWLAPVAPGTRQRAYRFATHAKVFAALEAHAAGDAAAVRAVAEGASPLVTQLAHGLAHELAGEWSAAAQRFEAALAASPDGDFDCAIAVALERIRTRDAAVGTRGCALIRAPHVPRPACVAVRPRCR